MAALVGPNGAGKTTLLHMAVSLATPTAGRVSVLGGKVPGSPAALDGIAFVAQDAPLYRNLSVAGTLHLARNLNRGWDDGYARARLAELGIPLDRKAGRLLAVGRLPAAEPVLALPAHRGRLAARAVADPARGHGLAGAPPQRLSSRPRAGRGRVNGRCPGRFRAS